MILKHYGKILLIIFDHSVDFDVDTEDDSDNEAVVDDAVVDHAEVDADTVKSLDAP